MEGKAQAGGFWYVPDDGLLDDGRLLVETGLVKDGTAARAGMVVRLGFDEGPWHRVRANEPGGERRRLLTLEPAPSEWEVRLGRRKKLVWQQDYSFGTGADALGYREERPQVFYDSPGTALGNPRLVLVHQPGLQELLTKGGALIEGPDGQSRNTASRPHRSGLEIVYWDVETLGGERTVGAAAALSADLTGVTMTGPFDPLSWSYRLQSMEGGEWVDRAVGRARSGSGGAGDFEPVAEPAGTYDYRAVCTLPGGAVVRSQTVSYTWP